jgi:Ligated ion channel L-glutamate- and glycine-binding site
MAHGMVRRFSHRLVDADQRLIRWRQSVDGRFQREPAIQRHPSATLSNGHFGNTQRWHCVLTCLLHVLAAGMMGELVEERADIAAFPLTLTLDRSQAVDLSYSFMNGGLGILVSFVAVSPRAGEASGRPRPSARRSRPRLLDACHQLRGMH